MLTGTTLNFWFE
jgi:hypothetical protein